MPRSMRRWAASLPQGPNSAAVSRITVRWRLTRSSRSGAPMPSSRGPNCTRSACSSTPSRATRSPPDEWREPLGDIARAGDWIAFFVRELDERPWRDALDIWIRRLAPGIMAGATHGILRTAHAVRALERSENPLRVHELAEGLGYWAARYQALPVAAAPASAPHRARSPGARRPHTGLGAPAHGSSSTP